MVSRRELGWYWRVEVQRRCSGLRTVMQALSLRPLSKSGRLDRASAQVIDELGLCKGRKLYSASSRDQRACRRLSFWFVIKYCKFLWSEKISKGVVDP